MTLAEFFATGYWGLGDVVISGYLIGYKDGYLYCNYVMPFASSARVELINNTDTQIMGSYEIAVDENSPLTEEKGYFKAQIHTMESELQKPFIFHLIRQECLLVFITFSNIKTFFIKVFNKPQG